MGSTAHPDRGVDAEPYSPAPEIRRELGPPLTYAGLDACRKTSALLAGFRKVALSRL